MSLRFRFEVAHVAPSTATAIIREVFAHERFADQFVDRGEAGEPGPGELRRRSGGRGDVAGRRGGGDRAADFVHRRSRAAGASVWDDDRPAGASGRAAGAPGAT